MKLTNTHAAQSDDQGPNKWLVHALIFNMVIVAAIWTTVVHLYHGGNSVASFLLFFVFIATAGMSMKIWFYTWMMLFTMDALRGEDDPSSINWAQPCGVCRLSFVGRLGCTSTTSGGLLFWVYFSRCCLSWPTRSGWRSVLWCWWELQSSAISNCSDSAWRVNETVWRRSVVHQGNDRAATASPQSLSPMFLGIVSSTQKSIAKERLSRNCFGTPLFNFALFEYFTHLFSSPELIKYHVGYS